MVGELPTFEDMRRNAYYHRDNGMKLVLTQATDE
jgi:hypothetical protein